MTLVAVLGAGAGGLSATVELTLAGHRVALWNRNAQTLAANVAGGVVRFEGVLGKDSVAPYAVTGDLTAAVRDAEAVVVCLPSIAHRRLFDDLAQLRITAPVVLNPGHTGAALEARRNWEIAGARLPPLAELSTLTYVARVHDGVVRTTGRAGAVRVAGLPGADAAVTVAGELFPGAQPVTDVLASSLANVNLVLHPPGAVLAMAWSEATGGDYTFYREAMTPGVAEGGDRPRRRTARGRPSLRARAADVARRDGGDRHGGPGRRERWRRGSRGPRRCGQPVDQGPWASTTHRYYREDFPYGLQPFVALADVAAVEVPVAGSILAIAAIVLGPEVMQAGRTAEALGIAGMSQSTLLDIVRAQ